MAIRRSFDSLDCGGEDGDGSNKRPKIWGFHDPAVVYWPESLLPAPSREGYSNREWLRPADTFQFALDHAWRSERYEKGLCLLDSIWCLFDSEATRDHKVRSFFKQIYKDRFKGDSSVHSLPLLHMVALCGLRKSLKFLVHEEGDDVNQLDELGLTALHRCVEADVLPDKVKGLLKNGADETIRDTLGETALHRASFRAEHCVASVLAKHSRTINARGQGGRAPLHNAIQGMLLKERTKGIWEPQVGEKRFESVKRRQAVLKTERLDIFTICRIQKTIATLLDNGANINAQDNDGCTALHLAVHRGCEDITTYLLNAPQGHVAIDTPDARGYTPLLTAAEVGDHKMLQQLFLMANETNHYETRSGRNLLSVIAEMPVLEGSENRTFLDWVESLINDKGLEADKPDHEGRAPLSYAAEVGNVLLVRLLLNTGSADASRMDMASRSPLSYFAGAKTLSTNAGLGEFGPGGSLIGWDEVEKQVCQLLLQKAIDVAEVKDKEGRTPFSYAKVGNYPLRHLLLERAHDKSTHMKISTPRL